jgi:hypothetical protein
MIVVMRVVVLAFMASAMIRVLMSTVVVRAVVVMVIAAATAVIVPLVSMCGRVPGRCSRYGRGGQFRDIEP